MWKNFIVATGIEKLSSAIINLRNNIERNTSNVPYAILEQAVEKLTSYPEERDGNRPPPPYWSRGEGHVRRGGAVNPLSEEFGGPAPFGNMDSWDVRQLRGGEWVAESTVSYAPFLVSDHYQSYIHAGHWKTVDDVLEEMGLSGTEVGGDVAGAFNAALKKIVDELANEGGFTPYS